MNGPLTFLPIHAAGIYTENDLSGSRLSDYAVSSYIPSMATLSQCQQPRASVGARVLNVALPVEGNLPHSLKDITTIEQIVGHKSINKLLEGAATSENVKRGMEECSFVHFSCHGQQNPNDPTQSALLLANDTKLTLAEIIKLKLPHARFAFLAACQTATGAQDLPEEAIHLAAGMLVAGYQGVVATMWSIQDSNGPIVTEEFYKFLWKDGKPDVTQAAYALHYAVEKLRKESPLFLQWVPFIHMGL